MSWIPPKERRKKNVDAYKEKLLNWHLSVNSFYHSLARINGNSVLIQFLPFHAKTCRVSSGGDCLFSEVMNEVRPHACFKAQLHSLFSTIGNVRRCFQAACLIWMHSLLELLLLRLFFFYVLFLCNLYVFSIFFNSRFAWDSKKCCYWGNSFVWRKCVMQLRVS